MSDNTEQIVTTVTNQKHEDPESPTLAVPQSTSTTAGTAERRTDVVVTDNNADTATSNNEAEATSFQLWIRHNTNP